MYRLPMTSIRPLLAAAGLLCLAAPPALGAWSAPEQASRGPLPARAPEVASNARGDAAVVWVRGSRRAQMIVASVRPAGGDWEEPVAISRRGRPAIDPEVAVDGQGRVIVAWRQVVRRRVVDTRRGPVRQAVYVVRTRERALEETRWSRVRTLSSGRQKVGPPELAVDDSGVAVATWHWGTGTAPGDRGFVGQVQYVERRGDGTWTGPARLSRSTLCAEVRLPRVSVGLRGHAVVWWQCDLPADRSTALARTRVPGGGFGTEVELPFRTGGDVTADLAVAGDGQAVAVSADENGTLSWWRGQTGLTLGLAALPVLGAADRVDGEAGAPAVAINASGDALSGWIDAGGRPRAAPIAADLGVGTPTSLGQADPSAGSARVAVGSDRRGVTAWVSDARVMASARASDGTIAVGESVSSTGVSETDPPAVAMAADGEASLFWTRISRGRPVVERATSAP
jgi:hypothetical protein